MNIYENALFVVRNMEIYKGEGRTAIKALERAKKVEKLLKYQSNYIDSIIDSLNVIIEKSKLSQEMLEKELEELK